MANFQASNYRVQYTLTLRKFPGISRCQRINLLKYSQLREREKLAIWRDYARFGNNVNNNSLSKTRLWTELPLSLRWSFMTAAFLWQGMSRTCVWMARWPSASSVTKGICDRPNNGVKGWHPFNPLIPGWKSTSWWILSLPNRQPTNHGIIPHYWVVDWVKEVAQTQLSISWSIGEKGVAQILFKAWNLMQ